MNSYMIEASVVIVDKVVALVHPLLLMNASCP
jgi:hypothetical protein